MRKGIVREGLCVFCSEGVLQLCRPFGSSFTFSQLDRGSWVESFEGSGVAAIDYIVEACIPSGRLPQTQGLMNGIVLVRKNL
jgi:hypothetical protein